MTNGEVYDGVITNLIAALGHLPNNFTMCDDCKYLKIVNDGKVYAICEQTDFEFMPFGTDTSKHFCAYGERKEN